MESAGLQANNYLASLKLAMQNIPEEVIDRAGIANPWFTPDNIRLSGEKWAAALSDDLADRWISEICRPLTGQTVGIIMAGNIPFVGLHDLITTLVCGKKARIKLSSSDEILMKYAVDALLKNQAQMQERISISSDLKGIDYLLATGSNNSSRYFEYYFRNIPSLIRKSRTSVAVLSHEITDDQLSGIADDIYTYFGLGCRNITHILFPQGFELKRFYVALDKYMDLVHHHKYYNNYMYHKSIFLMNLDKHYDNGFMLFRETMLPHAPLATLNYHYYSDRAEASDYLQQHAGLWQCIVSDTEWPEGSIAPGSTQSPGLWDYADHMNIPEFLSS